MFLKIISNFILSSKKDLCERKVADIFLRVSSLVT
jgi:hypothetical protein